LDAGRISFRSDIYPEDGRIILSDRILVLNRILFDWTLIESLAGYYQSIGCYSLVACKSCQALLGILVSFCLVLLFRPCYLFWSGIARYSGQPLFGAFGQTLLGILVGPFPIFWSAPVWYFDQSLLGILVEPTSAQ
jgi:hypothetical protein